MYLNESMLYSFCAFSASPSLVTPRRGISEAAQAAGERLSDEDVSVSNAAAQVTGGKNQNNDDTFGNVLREKFYEVHISLPSHSEVFKNLIDSDFWVCCFFCCNPVAHNTSNREMHFLGGTSQDVASRGCGASGDLASWWGSPTFSPNK